jgi:hypothetical protein
MSIIYVKIILFLFLNKNCNILKIFVYILLHFIRFWKNSLYKFLLKYLFERYINPFFHSINILDLLIL